MKIATTIFFYLAFNLQQSLSAQIITTQFDKPIIKMNESLFITFKTTASVDSSKAPKLENFIIAAGPNKSSSFTSKNGVATQEYSQSYIVHPKKTGVLLVDCPVFYSGATVISGRDTTIQITGESLTGAEQKAFEYTLFKSDAIKPKDTYRYVINGEMGFVEWYDGSTWKFYKDLTADQIKSLEKMK